MQPINNNNNNNKLYLYSTLGQTCKVLRGLNVKSSFKLQGQGEQCEC